MSDNRLIVKNTIALYIRMGLTVFVSLFTARIVLQQLGVKDYGVYNVVAGVIAMMSFLNAAMSGATSRFITYESHNGYTEKLKLTFGSAVFIHYVIALVIFVLGETIGLWFVNTQLVIPQESMTAANVVYQFSILTSCLTIIQTPYNAVIISHERFTIYAYIEILNVIAKLFVAYLLVVISSNRLILYGLFNFCVTVFVFAIYRFYCRRKFVESNSGAIWDKAIGRPMLSFSAWDLFGNMSVTANFQGYGIAMNMIYGATINAAYGIANTVQGTLKGLALNIVSASRPQIIKSYADGDLYQMQQLMINASNIGLIIYLMMAIPLYFNASVILSLWLVDVPDYSVQFLRIVLLSGVFNLCNQVINTAIHATGSIRRLSIYPGVFYLIAPFICYLLMQRGMAVEHAFYTIVVIYLINLLVCLLIMQKQIPQINVWRFIIKSYMKPFIACLFTAFVCHVIDISNIYVNTCIDILVAVVSLATFYLFFCLSFSQRHNVIKLVKTKLFGFRQ